jgi:hypothetical protein
LQEKEKKMASNLLKTFEEDFFLLLEAGFVAVNDADEDSALKLFKAAELLRPTDPFPKIGFGYMHMCKLELKHACAVFNQVLELDPKNEMAKTFLAICMSLSPNQLSTGESMLEEASTKSHDPAIKKLANTAMDFVDAFVKKSPSPMTPKSPEKREKK